MPWMLNEAESLKSKLSGITTPAPTQGETADVEVWFRNPENELRDMTFPSVVLEFASVTKADDREHRGSTYLPYTPEPYTSPSPTTNAGGQVQEWDTTTDFDPTFSPFLVQDYPIPYNIDFVATAYARFEYQLLALVDTLSSLEYLPSRFGYLEVAADDTVRTLDVIGGPEIISNRDREGRRLFQAVYRVRVCSELNLYDVEQIVAWVKQVNLTLETIPSEGNLWRSTLNGVDFNAIGTETFTGTLTSALTGATLASAGSETISGRLSTTLAGATLAAHS